ncbi:MAG: NUDIX hydrolase [Bacilli bacterium]
MKEIITNENNLKETDMTEVVKRVKIMLVNSNNELLLAYSHNDYQFPGGHVEENETLNETVKREILEETGIELLEDSFEAFACGLGYYKDWPSEGKNRKIEIYYYCIKTDKLPNIDNTNYTDHEKEGNFKLEYIKFDEVEKVLLENAKLYGDKRGITKEMLKIFNIYKEIEQ